MTIVSDDIMVVAFTPELRFSELSGKERFMKNTMDSMIPVWQLPVRERVLVGKSDWVHPLAKFHCFVGGKSLCGKYEQDTDFLKQILKVEK